MWVNSCFQNLNYYSSYCFFSTTALYFWLWLPHDRCLFNSVQSSFLHLFMAVFLKSNLISSSILIQIFLFLFPPPGLPSCNFFTTLSQSVLYNMSKPFQSWITVIISGGLNLLYVSALIHIVYQPFPYVGPYIFLTIFLSHVIKALSIWLFGSMIRYNKSQLFLQTNKYVLQTFLGTYLLTYSLHGAESFLRS